MLSSKRRKCRIAAGGKWTGDDYLSCPTTKKTTRKPYLTDKGTLTTGSCVNGQWLINGGQGEVPHAPQLNMYEILENDFYPYPARAQHCASL